ncbi:MAG: valine--tRNA ligase, partial [Verrucomicrobiota bacterium]
MKEQKGFMYHFKVEVVEQPGTFLTIATTRPETIPADTAVAVNPKDPRYQHLIGQHVYRALPLDQSKDQRVIPIIADEHVAFDFGTGVLKVTPAHDKADFEIGLRHRLPVVDVLTPDGKMTAEAGAELAGLDRFVARKKAAEILEAAGALEKAEPYVNNVGFSERADVPIEPRLSEQWFLKYPSVEASKACVATGEMKFFPDRWAKVYDHWMTGIQDWCISRQLWWGHRIPVWYRANPGPSDPRKGSPEDLDGHYPIETVCQIDRPGGEGWEQDPDVLDTWFSSWLWPFATMGWTGDQETDSKNPTLKAFYPTTDLVTGPDIIFFWVARMIMAGYEWMGDLPFRNVYFTGIIRDKQGRKMSKSLGNSPDPLDLIAKYGADALRFGVMRAAPLGQDVLFDEQSVELGRNFCTKLWNACRFRQMQGGATEAEIAPDRLTSDDRWILRRLDQAIREVTQAFADYKFSDATATLYRFFWSEYCDWYVEASKAAFHGADEKLKANKLAVIDFVLGNLLRLFHPFLPFITEELWHGMGFHQDLPDERGGRTLMFATWPKPLSAEEREYFGLDDAADQVAQAKYDLVTLGRNLKAQFNLPSNKRVAFVLRPAGELDTAEVEVLRLLLNAETVTVAGRDWVPDKGTPVAANALGELYLPLAGLLDVAAERTRLGKEREKIVAEIAKVEEKLGNPSFTQKVPAKVLEEHRQRLADWQAKLKQVDAALANLPG